MLLAKGLVFEDEMAAKATFELGKVSFRCSVCGRIHWSGSKAARKCLGNLRGKLEPYVFESRINDFRLSDEHSTWRYWGRERELLEYVALESYVYRSTRPSGEFVWSDDSVGEYALALPSDYVQKLNERNMLEVYGKVKGEMNGAFKQAFNRGLELDHFFKEAKCPNLPLPLMVDFATHWLSFDGQRFISFDEFFQPRIAEAAKFLEEDKALSPHFRYVVIDSAYRKLFPASDHRYIMRAGYFLPHGVYIVIEHGKLYEKNCYRSERHYRGYYVFYLRNYERLEFVEMLLELGLSFKELISKLIEKAKAA